MGRVALATLTAVARSCMQGRLKTHERCQNKRRGECTNGVKLHERSAKGGDGGVNGISTPYKNHLELAIACKGGGSGADCIKTP